MLWQAVMLGFAALDLRGDKLGIDRGSRPSGAVCRSPCVGEAGPSGSASLTGPWGATLVQGQPMEMRITDVARKLTAGATVQVSL